MNADTPRARSEFVGFNWRASAVFEPWAFVGLVAAGASSTRPWRYRRARKSPPSRNATAGCELGLLDSGGFDHGSLSRMS